MDNKKKSSKQIDGGFSDDDDSKIKGKSKAAGNKKDIIAPLFKTDSNVKIEMNNTEGMIFYNQRSFETGNHDSKNVKPSV